MVMCDAHAELRYKRKLWLDCLDGDDDNSIFNQLTRITRNITTFRVLMEEVYALAPDAEGGGKQLNRLLFGLLQESFADSLMMGLRRLLDNAALDGSKGVYSLSSLLKNIGDYSHLLTRDAILQLGPPGYSMKDGNRSGVFLENWACTMNGKIDKFTSINEDQRAGNDRIPKAFFDDQRRILVDGFANVQPLINKEIAHAATPESRTGFNYQRITWGDLYDLHSELCKAAHVLLDIFSETGMKSFLPVFQGDEFQHLSRPIIAEKDLQRLANRWAELQAESESWSKWRPSLSENHRLDGAETPD